MALLSEKLLVLAFALQFVSLYAVNPAKIHTNLIKSETKVHWPHFYR